MTIDAASFKEFLDNYTPLVELQTVTHRIEQNSPNKHVLYVFNKETEYARYYIIVKNSILISTNDRSIIRMIEKNRESDYSLLTFSAYIYHPAAVYMLQYSSDGKRLETFRATSYDEAIGIYINNNRSLIQEILMLIKKNDSDDQP